MTHFQSPLFWASIQNHQISDNINKKQSRAKTFKTDKYAKVSKWKETETVGIQYSCSALHTSQSWYEKQNHDVYVRSLKTVFLRSEKFPFFLAQVALPGGKLDLDPWFSQEWQIGRCAADVKLSPASQRIQTTPYL